MKIKLYLVPDTFLIFVNKNREFCFQYYFLHAKAATAFCTS